MDDKNYFTVSIVLKFFIFYFIFLNFLAMLSLCCYLGFSLDAGSRDYSLVATCGLLIAAASYVVERGCAGFRSCGGMWAQELCSQALEHRRRSGAEWAQLLCSMWDLPGFRIEPMSPALAGEFFTTEPSEKPQF